MLYLSLLRRPSLGMFLYMSYGRRPGGIWVEGLLRPPSEGRPTVDLGLQGQPSASWSFSPLNASLVTTLSSWGIGRSL